MAELPYEADDDRGAGFVAPLASAVVRDADGKVVWDADAYGRVDGGCPATAHPSLWAQAGLLARRGLYEVAEGVYQVRGLDRAAMTLVEGDTGVVVVDPLRSAECAVAALRLYRGHRGDRPVSAVIYSHSRADRFGGSRGVTLGGVPVLAPRRLPGPRRRGVPVRGPPPRTAGPPTPTGRRCREGPRGGSARRGRRARSPWSRPRR
ncbi:MBL fold metallo-hydrolase [Nonomuraea ferruginea]